MVATETCLWWSDVDPSTHTVDLAAVRTVVEDTLRLATAAGADAHARANAVDRALLVAFGPWLAGWRWTQRDGGPVVSYCCESHSLRGDVAGDANAILAGVEDWIGRLAQLATEFDTLSVRTKGMDAPAKASCGASHLLPLVLEWTNADDAWYVTFELVLAWYLERELGNARLALEIAGEMINGRFASWIGPDEEEFPAIGAETAEVTARKLAAAIPDSTAAWATHRDSINWDQRRLYEPGVVPIDGHDSFILDVDTARDAARARRLVDALARCRAWAREGGPLSLERLTELQEIVLGERARVRTRDAFAHGGAERYGLSDGLEERFARYLGEANDERIPPHARAARVYLDICFVHPFADGNARAARLALDYVLTRAGLALHAAAPVFVVARRALDTYGPYRFMHVIDYLAGAKHLR